MIFMVMLMFVLWLCSSVSATTGGIHGATCTLNSSIAHTGVVHVYIEREIRETHFSGTVLG